jgi:hypothetical protein
MENYVALKNVVIGMKSNITMRQQQQRCRQRRRQKEKRKTDYVSSIDMV